MKDKPSEWVSISDLMAGVMAVVMLLLVVSVMQQTYAEVKLNQEIEKGKDTQKKIVATIFGDMKQSLKQINSENLISVDTLGYKIIFKDGIFERGSAKITPEVQNAFLQTQQKVRDFLLRMPDGKISVEGHTDNIPVSKPVIDFEKYGAVYDDNYTLSAARAREARKVIIGNLSEKDANRIIVAGYGSSRPLDANNPDNGCNRRVEIRFSIGEKN